MSLRKMFLKEFLSLIFPLRCPVCDEILSPEETDAGIHEKCENKFYPVQGAVCMHCGRPLRKNLRIYQKNHTNKYLHLSGGADLNHRNLHLAESDRNFDDTTKEYCQECLKRGYVHSSQHGNSLQRSENQKNSSIVMGKALYLYRGDIKQTMYRFKYSNKREYAYFFAKQAVERYPELFFDTRIDAIIPVPMYIPKKRRRGYNQAESFAHALSEFTAIPVDTKLVQRIKDTTPQKELNDIERKNNLKNAFQIRKSVVKYNKVIVVDDIYTTGSTIETVAEELKYMGIHQIYVFCICIGEEM